MRKTLLALIALVVMTSSQTVVGQAPSARTGIGAVGAEPAKGDQQRQYVFEAGKEMPYRLYVPQTYDPKVGAPLVVALHGYGGNQDYFFRLVGGLPALCEQYGFIFVAPMGYATDGWYGAPLSVPGNAPRSSGQPAPAPARTPEEETRYRALSEADVMMAVELVRKEYRIDPDGIYLMGHSMGGFGAWFLGQKYADMWAAIAPMSGVLPDIDYNLSKLADAKVAVHVSIGALENPAWVEASRTQIDAMKLLGMKAAYVEVEGATHMSMIPATVPWIFDFFSKQRKGG